MSDRPPATALRRRWRTVLSLDDRIVVIWAISMAVAWASLAEDVSAIERFGFTVLGALCGAAVGARVVLTMGDNRWGRGFVAVATLAFIVLALVGAASVLI